MMGEGILKIGSMGEGEEKIRHIVNKVVTLVAIRKSIDSSIG